MAKKAAIQSVVSLETKEEKNKALGVVLEQIEKQYGKGSLMRMSEDQKLEVEVIPSGSILLDEALGVGGYPKGRIIEVYGPESSGKTTLTLHAIAECQKQGGTAAFIDAEHALDPQYAKKLGLKIEDLWVSQPDSGEQALEIADTLVRSGAVDLVVIDSVAALTPSAEITGEMGDSHVGLQARLMSQALRKLTANISKSGCIVFFINQIRMKIGVMFGSPETTAGGNALKFYCSVRLDVRRIETLSKGTDEAYGNRVRVKVVKNKVAPPFRKCEFDIIFGKGISALGCLVDAALKCELIKKSGSWFSRITEKGEEKIGQGRDNVIQFLSENPELAAGLETAVRQKLFETKAVDEGKGTAPAAKKVPKKAEANMPEDDESLEMESKE
ncbi:recombinase RecA [Candidatus Haliotispira prima]|uniref:Protein RecA n=1 Tax=Candidatus Haliotispira prima TaxID=3034016 RepID=A0ABY8MGE1_9SPIO|nr:recombinase RecA [Candidatus Haliotispira prima]